MCSRGQRCLDGGVQLLWLRMVIGAEALPVVRLKASTSILHLHIRPRYCSDLPALVALLVDVYLNLFAHGRSVVRPDDSQQ